MSKTGTVLLPTGCKGKAEPHAFYRCPRCVPIARTVNVLDQGERVTLCDSYLLPVAGTHPCQRGCGAEMER